MDKIIKKEISNSKPVNSNFHKLFQRKMDISFSGLLEMGTKGHFPLFPQQWIHSHLSCNMDKENFQTSLTEVENFEKILSNLSNYPSLDKKRVLLFSLKEKDREQFIRMFFKLVESKILDQKNHIQ